MQKTISITVRIVILLTLLATAFGLATRPAAASIEIPYDAAVSSATLRLYVRGVWGPNMNVTIHRVTGAWDEATATWNTFNGAYDSAVVNNFMVGSSLGRTIEVDVTSLVQGWTDGLYPNYGLLIQSSVVEPNFYAVYDSKEAPLQFPVPVVPALKICWNNNTVCSEYDTAVQDTYIHQLFPNDIRGTWPILYTGNVSNVSTCPMNNCKKQSLIQFDIKVKPPEYTNPGTGTPGFWKNHPEAWPTGSIVIGGITYSKDQAIEWLKTSDKQDKTITMFRALVSAKLNVMIGNNPSCISTTLTAADAWMAAHPVGSLLPASDAAWTVEGQPLATTLDNYNNGLLCAPHRD